MNENASPDLDEKQLFYERFAGEFDANVNRYDLEKRVRIVFDRLLPESLENKLLLDAGCGTGWFSQRAVQRGSRVVSMDVGIELLHEVAKKCETNRAIGDTCRLAYRDGTFDVVISSEVIEHVRDPGSAVRELTRVLKPGGILVLTTPNKPWYFAIWIANKIGARPYEGHENWVGFGELARLLAAQGLVVEEHIGFHLFPFLTKLSHPILDFMDRFGISLGPIMLNQAIRVRKLEE